MERRSFFKMTTIAGGGLLIGTFLPLSCINPKKLSSEDWEPNFYLKISPDNTIIFICPQSEIGQGTSTGLAMIVAEELGANFENLKLEFAEGSKEKYQYNQDTGGSNGIRMLWDPFRTVLATTREILISAAAQKWNLSSSDCYTADSRVLNTINKETLPFGDLIELASELPAPKDVKLKDKTDYQYIGKSLIGKKTEWAAKGIIPFSINMVLPNMVYAAIARCPVWGGQLVSYEDREARAMEGVIDIFEIEAVEVNPQRDYEGGIRAGVVVVATNTWVAFQAKNKLKIEWDLGPNQKKEAEDVLKELAISTAQAKQINHDFNNGLSEFRKGKEQLEATYTIPYQANACMEPLNAVAYHKGYEIEVWSGTQSPKLARERLAKVSGLPEAAITVHNQPSGGGFGRRFFADFIEEAVTISEKMSRPVKLCWSREDTIQTSKYHPIGTETYHASLDDNNRPIAISYRGMVSKPSGFRAYPYSLPITFYGDVKYLSERLLPRASWRSVAAHHWIFGLESFIDELAFSAGKDPIAFRLEELENAAIVEQVLYPWVGDNLYPHKLKNTLEIAAQKAGWGQPKTNGRHQGVSCICYNTSYCTQIVDISVESGQLKVHKFLIVLDCGLAVNPSQVKAQVEGSIVWGLSAVLNDPITVKNGMVEQSNFHNYPIPKMKDCPEIEIHLIESDDPPSGTGEIVVPGVAPAIMNAVFAATGKRIRGMPIGNLS